MIKIQFTEEAIDELRYQRFNHPHPWENERIVYFVDAAHFVPAPFLGFLCRAGPSVHPGACRQTAFQRAGSDRRHNASTGYGQ